MLDLVLCLFFQFLVRGIRHDRTLSETKNICRTRITNQHPTQDILLDPDSFEFRVAACRIAAAPDHCQQKAQEKSQKFAKLQRT